MQGVNDGPRCFRGRHKAVDDISGQVLAGCLQHGRNIGQRRSALAAEHRQSPQTAIADIVHARRQRSYSHRRVSAACRCDPQAAALERNVDDVHPERKLEQFPGKMRRRAGTGRGIAVLPRIGLGQRNQFIDARGGNRGMDDKDMRRRIQQGNRGEVVDRIIGQFGVEAAADGNAAAHGKQGVAIRCRARNSHHAQIAAGTAHVLDDERLTEGLRELDRHQPCGRIGLPARPACDDDANRLDRIGLCNCRA